MANSYNLWRARPWLARYFQFDRAARKRSRIGYETPRMLRRAAQQYLYHSWRFAGDVVRFQVERFY